VEYSEGSKQIAKWMVFCVRRRWSTHVCALSDRRSKSVWDRLTMGTTANIIGTRNGPCSSATASGGCRTACFLTVASAELRCRPPNDESEGKNSTTATGALDSADGESDHHITSSDAITRAIRRSIEAFDFISDTLSSNQKKEIERAKIEKS
jgi:hypothetical protein